MPATPSMVWIILRQDPFTGPYPVAAAHDAFLVDQAVRDLGPEHIVHPAVPLLIGHTGHSVIAWWRCTATVTATETTIGTPTRMPGASHLLLPGQRIPVTERVVVDDIATRMEHLVNGAHVHYIQAYAIDPQRARHLAEQHAHQLRQA